MYMQPKKIQSSLLWSVATILGISVPIFLWLVPPPLFSSATVHVQRGESVSQAAQKLTDAGVVYTPELLIIPFLASGEQIVAGTYAFEQPENASTVYQRVASGSFGIPQGRVVIPEGFTNEQIAYRIEGVLDSEQFSRPEFIKKAYSQQGYLYPDTYDFHADSTADEIIAVMRDNFDTKIDTISEELSSTQYALDDVIKMASLIELEAADYQIRRRIAGVLWKRIDEGMPLQVDAAFVSLIGKNTYELTMADLQIDSPYNLYTNTGLPPRPIANPSIQAVRATIDPIMGNDLYYLSDRDQNFYFAETLPGHAKNRRAYLDAGGN
jgi:UPF0755 protein